MASITSIEMNYMIFRYLQESGFTHSAFVFGSEAGTATNSNKAPMDGNLVPPDALVKLVQKGLQYLEMEANLTDSTNGEADVDADFLTLQAMDLITKDEQELRKIVKEKRRELNTGVEGKEKVVKRNTKRTR